MAGSGSAGAASGYTYCGPADGEAMASLRRLLRAWLHSTVAISTQRACDIVLAVGEAIANCAEHAYRDHATCGAMTLDLSYDHESAAVVISVADQGGWLEPVVGAVNSNRGRGLILMRALADACSVDGRGAGTTVRLRFLRCPARNPAVGTA